MIKVGIIHSGYREGRNFINLPYKKVSFVKIVDIYKIINHIFFKLFNKVDFFSYRSFNDFGLYSVDINHFFLGVSFTKRPWITTYSSAILGNPNGYEERWHNLASARLADNSCKKIICISKYAKGRQIYFLNQHYTKLSKIIGDKIIVIQPQQKLIINNYDEKKLDPVYITFTFVGADFFRKGGMEIIKVFEILKDEKIKLNIISTLQYGDYASHSTEKDYFEVKKIINTNHNITHYNKLPNDKVLGILKNSHIALLPTYDDAYGYSILEAQATGCPVISTDTNALPEVNNDSVGWLICVPKNDLGESKRHSFEERKDISDIIERELLRIIKYDILLDYRTIRKKGEDSMKRIQKEHNPVEKAVLIEQLYINSLK